MPVFFQTNMSVIQVSSFMEPFSLPCLLPLSFIAQEQNVLRTLVLSRFEEKLEEREKKKIPTACICVAKTTIQIIINCLWSAIKNWDFASYLPFFFCFYLLRFVVSNLFFPMSQDSLYWEKNNNKQQHTPKPIHDCPTKVIPLNTTIN